ncbi:hypothetical protein BD626DRAFT_114996 [Schizophyllum amplum]|uniref:Uncharacterized protein n=1 Tax=Schizophyllum amplum TaxID=97359 RepID=A0A550CU97_9AGAR|nr:hypothetical protein BD626DRAFT_114996 [Auriculariopsis ampla]
MKADKAVMSEEIDPFIQQIAARMRPYDIIQNHLDDVWLPDVNSRMPQQFRSFIEDLKIPVVLERPSLLLHELGQMDKIDPSLESRIQEVFKHDRILVNTSGAGKTRLLLEGLCRYWGLYFVATKAGDRSSSALGSADMSEAIDDYLPDGLSRDGLTFAQEIFDEESAQSQQTEDFPASPPRQTPSPPHNRHDAHAGAKGPLPPHAPLSMNRAVAKFYLSTVLLARLLLFKCFLTVSRECFRQLNSQQGFDAEQYWRDCKKAWLLVQLKPSYLVNDTTDPFALLSRRLHPLRQQYVSSLIADTLHEVQALLAHSTTRTYERRYLVLDEAQYAAYKWPRAFRCKDDTKARPVFREILCSWSKVLAHHNRFYFVCAGNAVAPEVADDSFASAFQKESAQADILHAMGVFDDVQYIEKYARRYLPPSYADGHEGKRLMRRIVTWLRGRPRLVANYMAQLMTNGYQNPHVVLNRYIFKFSEPPKFTGSTPSPHILNADGDEVDLAHGFSPSDSAAFAVQSMSVHVSGRRYPWDIEYLHKYYSGKMATLLRIVVNVMIRSAMPPAGSIGNDEAQFVQQGIAWFNSDGQAVVDEPLILLTLLRWFDRQKYRMPQNAPVFESTYSQVAHNVQITDPKHNGFEEYLALVLVDFVFSKGRKLSDIFDFTGSSTPSFADWDATLVGMFKPDGGSSAVDIAEYEHDRLRRPSFAFGFNSDGFEKNLAWLRHEVGYQAILFPDNFMGPDLIFVLRLQKAGEDDAYIWCALQAKGRETPADVAHAVKTVTPLYFHSGSSEKGTKKSQHQKAYRTELQALPGRHPDAGKHGVLRVVASYPFDLELTEKKVGKELWDNAKHGPLAKLNMDLLNRLTKNMSPKHTLQNWRDKKSWDYSKGGDVGVKRKLGDNTD